MSFEAIIDIETLGVQANSIILTIGGIKFKRYEKIQDLDNYQKFYKRIDIDSCKEKGLQTDKDTIIWWNEQSDNIRHESIFHPDRYKLEEVLKELSGFLIDCKYIWSQGSFDSIILENAYKKCNLPIPWKFWQIRDSRTLFDVLNVDLKSIEYKSNEVHNALVDCYRQLIATTKCFEKIKK
jgi:exodeoxyribonuclease VIII